MAKGGKREGAGRKRGGKNPNTIAQDKADAYYRQAVRKEFSSLLKSQLELSKGVYVTKSVTIGDTVVDVKVYKEKPDRGTIEYLINRVLGKPSEQVKLEVEVDITMDF